MLNPFAAKAILAAREVLEGEDLVALDFGNQRYDGRVPGTEGLQTAAEFYEWAGFSDYRAVDVNEERGAFVGDLNSRLVTQSGYLNQPNDGFNLVVNNGTGEHVFDQRWVFQNAHEACRRDGVMLHVLPLCPWVNHGFYNYNPIIFRDLAAANGYGWAFLWLGDREQEPYRYAGVEPFLFKEKRPTELARILREPRWKTDVYCAVAWRKLHDGEFRVPIQGKYRRAVADEHLARRYG